MTTTNNALDGLALEADARQGVVMLNKVYDFLGRFVAYPSEHARVAHALDMAAAAVLGRNYAGSKWYRRSYELIQRHVPSATNPPQADLTIRITTVITGCELPEALTDVQVSILALNGSVQRTLDFGDVSSPGGMASVRLGRVARRQPRLDHRQVLIGQVLGYAKRHGIPVRVTKAKPSSGSYGAFRTTICGG